MLDDFYRAFEERHRGSWSDIRSRLEVYRPILDTLAGFSEKPLAVDLGCGRGEYLDLLSDVGFEVQGVDISAAMVAESRKRGFKVFQADALEWLSHQPDRSFTLVSALHVVEHLSFEYLNDLIAQISRVLAPGGVLIIETPNPENIIVGSCHFYLDPTHQRPLPPLLLTFLVEYHGFTSVTYWGVQTSDVIEKAEDPGLLGVIGGVSPDYAIIAQSPGPRVLKDALLPILQQRKGLTIEDLARRHAEAQNKKIQGLIDHQVQSFEGFRSELTQVQTGLTFLREKLDRSIEQYQSGLAQAQAELLALRSSYSWRLTAPLRLIFTVVRYPFRQVPKIKKWAIGLLVGAIARLDRHPRLIQAAIHIAERLGLADWLLPRYRQWVARLRRTSIPSPVSDQPVLSNAIGENARQVLNIIDSYSVLHQDATSH